MFSSAYSNDDKALLGRRPYYLSEEARRIHLNDRSVVGAISEAEIIQTIRALQVSTALLAAIGYGVENHATWGASDVAEYLCDRSHMAQNGVTFFLLSTDDALLKDTRLMSYDTSAKALTLSQRSNRERKRDSTPARATHQVLEPG